MNLNFLDFEQPIAELEAKIQELRMVDKDSAVNLSDVIARLFGMPKPEDDRKAMRLMQMAEEFKLPIFALIDTPGAYPGIKAEQSNQSEAIARNLLVMSRLKTPIICTVIGEGGSGGALA